MDGIEKFLGYVIEENAEQDHWSEQPRIVVEGLEVVKAFFVAEELGEG